MFYHHLLYNYNFAAVGALELVVKAEIHLVEDYQQALTQIIS